MLKQVITSFAVNSYFTIFSKQIPFFKNWCKYNITKQNITSAILLYDGKNVTFLKRTTKGEKIINLSF